MIYTQGIEEFQAGSTKRKDIIVLSSLYFVQRVTWKDIIGMQKVGMRISSLESSAAPNHDRGRVKMLLSSWCQKSKGSAKSVWRTEVCTVLDFEAITGSAKV